MNNQTPDLNALQLALTMEKDGYNFFKDAGNKAKNNLVKETFRSFAKWELEHIEFIKKLYQQLKGKGKWLSMNQMPQKKGQATATFKTIFKEKHDHIDEHVKIDTTDLEAYKVARDIEDKAIIFYRKKANSTANDIAKKFYELMTDLEREHYQILDNSYRYFENPAQWNLEEESWMFDGG